MASPRLEAFAVYDETTGAPLEGQAGSMSFVTYKDDEGNNISNPTISEVGGGWYKFTPTFADPDKGLVYIIDCGAGANPAQVARFMRPEDWNADFVPDVQVLIQDVKDFEQGKWEIPISGPNANHFVVYAPDGTTVLKKYQLLDAGGAPTATNPYKRIPD